MEKHQPNHQRPTTPKNLCAYVKQVKRLAEEIGINKKMLEEPFREEMKSNPMFLSLNFKFMLPALRILTEKY